MTDAFICDVARALAGWRFVNKAMKAVYPLHMSGARLALTAMCIGVGKDIVIVVERL